MWVWIFLAGLGRGQFSRDSMSMLLYESAQQRDGEPQSQSHCAFFLFFFLEQGSPLAHSQKCFGACSSSWGLSSTLSPFGNETYRTAEPPHWLFPWLMIAQVKRKPSKGKTMRPQRMDTQTQSMDEVHEVNVHLWREQSASNAFQSGALLFLQLFSNFSNEQRKAGATPSSYHPFNLTDEQNITVKLIRGLTVTECDVPHYPNHHYFPWLRCEAVSVQVSLQRDFHSVLSSYFCCFSQLLKHRTDIGRPKCPRLIEHKCVNTACIFFLWSHPWCGKYMPQGWKTYYVIQSLATQDDRDYSQLTREQKQPKTNKQTNTN